MYRPRHFAAADATVRDFLGNAGAGDLVTMTASGLVATFLPLIYDPAGSEHGSLLGHVARANDQWRGPVVGEALAILHGPDAYISPSWYPSKAEHGRVVPTWDYLLVQVHGRLVVHDDRAWKESLVRRLTDLHEAGLHEATNEPAWSVDDAPAAFIATQLGAIVGIEVVIGRIEAKAKWSQNRPRSDIEGVIHGLERAGQRDAAAAVRSAASEASGEAFSSS